MDRGREREAVDELSCALREVGLEVVQEPVDTRADLVVRGLGGVEFAIEVKRRALIRGVDIADLTRGLSTRDRVHGVVGLVVADRITEDAKVLLREDGWGWLDLRGHLHIEAPGIFIDARVTPSTSLAEGPREPLAGAVGVELASLLLMEPNRTFGVREAAAELDRAPSSVSQELSRLREAGLITAKNRPASPDLFQALARRWSTDSVQVSKVPEPGRGAINDALHLGVDDPEHERGWALGDTWAAIAYEAPISAPLKYPPDLYVPDRATLRRATQLLGTAASPRDRAATLRVAPVPFVTSRRVDEPNRSTWPLTHPLFVALDLAQDPGRGSEALAAWDPPPRWQRVW